MRRASEVGSLYAMVRTPWFHRATALLGGVVGGLFLSDWMVRFGSPALWWAGPLTLWPWLWVFGLRRNAVVISRSAVVVGTLRPPRFSKRVPLVEVECFVRLDQNRGQIGLRLTDGRIVATTFSRSGLDSLRGLDPVADALDGLNQALQRARSSVPSAGFVKPGSRQPPYPRSTATSTREPWWPTVPGMGSVVVLAMLYVWPGMADVPGALRVVIGVVLAGWVIVAFARP